MAFPLGPQIITVHDGEGLRLNETRLCELMIEQTKPVEERITGALEKRPARLKREQVLKNKISTIIKEHPNKSLSVIRRWLRDDPN